MSERSATDKFRHRLMQIQINSKKDFTELPEITKDSLNSDSYLTK